MVKVTEGRIIDIREIDDTTVIIRGLFGNRSFVFNEDIAVQLRKINPSDFLEGKEIKLIEDENEIVIRIKKKTTS